MNIARVRELNAELEKVVPCPDPEASPVSVPDLVRHYAAECLIHSARYRLSMKRSREWDGIPDVDLVEAQTASFAAAAFLKALHKADPAAAAQVAAGVLGACEDGTTTELAWDLAGDAAGQVTSLAEQIAEASAEPDEIARARDGQRRRDVDVWRAAGGTTTKAATTCTK